MINDANNNYLHPYHGVSLPNNCRSIFTDAVIANYASHDQREALRSGQDVQRERESRMGWNVAMVISEILL